MFRLVIAIAAFAAIATSPMLAFAAGARGQTFDEIVAEKVLGQFAKSDMRVRVLPVDNVCGQGQGHVVEVFVKRTQINQRGQLVSGLVKVKAYGVIEKLFGGPKLIDCGL